MRARETTAYHAFITRPCYEGRSIVVDAGIARDKRIIAGAAVNCGGAPSALEVVVALRDAERRSPTA